MSIAALIVNMVWMSPAFNQLDSAMKEVRIDIREVRADIKTIAGKLGAMDVEIAKLMDK